MAPPRRRTGGSLGFISNFYAAKAMTGVPYRDGLVSDDDVARRMKSLLLECTCGITDCWFLLARIEVGDVVVWSALEQFHRRWRYDLRFEFDRVSYEREIDARAPR